MTIEDLETALVATSDGATKLAQAKANYKDYAGGVYYKIGDTREYTSSSYWIENSNGVTGGTKGDSIPGTSLTYYKASSTSPVTATLTGYEYSPNSINSAVQLGGNYCWLASPCVNFGSNAVGFALRSVGAFGVGSSGVWTSSSVGAKMGSSGVRPLVSLPSSLQLDANGKITHTSQANAWKIIH